MSADQRMVSAKLPESGFRFKTAATGPAIMAIVTIAVSAWAKVGSKS